MKEINTQVNTQVNTPDFFIAGMPRSGTTSLYTYLKQHPNLFLSIYKEPNHFCADLTQSHYNITDPQLYNTLFNDAEKHQKTGEGSVWYLTSNTAAKTIKKNQPNAKMIIMLRNPVDMIYSLHDLYLRTENENQSNFQHALELEKERKKGHHIPPKCYFPEGLLYTEVGHYYQKIQHYVDTFGKDALHVIIFDDFATNTQQCCAQVLKFLDVDPDFPIETNPKKARQLIRPQVLEQLRRAPTSIRKMVALKTGEKHMGQRRPPMDQQLRTHLTNLFKPDLEKTARLINQDLSKWLNTE